MYIDEYVRIYVSIPLIISLFKYLQNSNFRLFIEDAHPMHSLARHYVWVMFALKALCHATNSLN